MSDSDPDTDRIGCGAHLARHFSLDFLSAGPGLPGDAGFSSLMGALTDIDCLLHEIPEPSSLSFSWRVLFEYFQLRESALSFSFSRLQRLLDLASLHRIVFLVSILQVQHDALENTIVAGQHILRSEELKWVARLGFLTREPFFRNLQTGCRKVEVQLHANMDLIVILDLLNLLFRQKFPLRTSGRRQDRKNAGEG